MFFVFCSKSCAKPVSQAFSIPATLRMIKINIRLFPLTTAIYVYKDGTFIVTFILFVKFVHPIAPLLQSLHLIKRNFLPHTCLTFAVCQIMPTSNAIFFILNNKMHFSSTHQQFPSQTKNNIISILIFMQLTPLIDTNCTGIRPSMPTYQIETGTFQFIGCNLIGSLFRSKQGFLA